MRSISSFLLVGVLFVAGLLLMTCSEDNPLESNNNPAAPTCGSPADGSTNLSTTATLTWSCTDTDGDALTYDVHFGTTATPSVVSTGQSGTSYSSGTLNYSTKYYWRIVAKDEHGAAATSDTWDFTTRAQPLETITTPTAPSGPSTGNTNQSLTYSTGGSTSNLGHSVEYRFVWAVGDTSAWSASTTTAHSWSADGTYSVKAQARCADHTSTVSAWSAAKSVVISVAGETVSTPTTPDGPITGLTNEDLGYSTGGSISSLGHSVEYRFVWEVGDTSSWSASTSVQHSWPDAGSYCVKAQARCTVDTDILSEWSECKNVTITQPDETISAPATPDGPGTGCPDESMSFSTSGSTSTLGHTIEYRFDWGDGNYSSWSSSMTSSHSWSAFGTYAVRAQARCAEHTSVISGWSTSKSVGVEETVSTPNAPSGPSGGEPGQSLSYTASGASSSCGHSLEYHFDWGDGNYSNWSSSTTASHSWSDEGTYSVKVQARCATHTAITSSWSGPLVVTVQEPVCDYDVEEPDYGEELRVGDTKYIEWDKDNGSDNVKIELYKGSSLQCTIDSYAPSDSEYEWVVDDCGGGSDDDYRIKVTDIADGGCYDYSSYFEIDAGPWTVICPAVKDAMTDSYEADDNYGTSEYLRVGTRVGGATVYMNSFIQFDLSDIPENAHIEEAELWLYVDNCWSSFTSRVNVVYNYWSETQITWNNSPSIYTSPVSYWNFSCGDGGGDYTIWIPVIDHVKRWIEDDYSNYGIALTCSPYPNYSANAYFLSREHSSTANRPRLWVKYTID